LFNASLQTYAEEIGQFELPKIPIIDQEEITNELIDDSEKLRGPSNSSESEYTPPRPEVLRWDYHDVIDRHDKR